MLYKAANKFYDIICRVYSDSEPKTMNNIYADIDNWLDLGDNIGLATVVHTWGSSPRPIGAKMAFTVSGKITGSVSGGCVEGAVYEAGVKSVQSNHDQLLHFGVSDETAFSVGLACGGKIDIFVRKLDVQLYRAARKQMDSHKPFALLSLIEGPDYLAGHEALLTSASEMIGSIENSIDARLIELAYPLIQLDKSQTISLATETIAKINIFVDVISPPPVLVIVGGVHIAITLASLAKTLGYRTVVIDPRRAFSSQERFPNVDMLIQSWPEEAFNQVELTSTTCVAVLTHDPKIDDPALKIALDSPVFYIGALGSRNTHSQRIRRLEQDGLSQEQITRIHAPIGLNLGGSTPEETALAVMAEIVAARHAPAGENRQLNMIT
jgi:xanthine dehydrogenase accessory factor